MDEAPKPLASRSIGEVASDRLPQLFLYSAAEREGTQRVVKSHLQQIELRKDEPDFLDDYSYTLGCRRSVLEWRSAIVADSAADLTSKIQNVDVSAVSRLSDVEKPKLCFIFCGQGAQWSQMGQDLLAFGVFRESLERASIYLTYKLGCAYDLLDEILTPGASSRINTPIISQPATTALQVALVDLLRSFDILPETVVGHSSGEIAAAYACKAIGREAAWEIAYFRGVWAANISLKNTKLRGAMIVVSLSRKAAEEYLEAIGGQAIQIACVNSPRSITLSGDQLAVDWVAADLCKKKIFHRVLEVQTAYHSSHMRLVEHQYAAALSNIVPSNIAKGVRMISSVRTEELHGDELTGAYWAENLVSPVEYLGAIHHVLASPSSTRPNMIMEISPSPALRSPTLDILAEMSDSGSTVSYEYLMGKGSNAISLLLSLAGHLWSRGYAVNMQAVTSRGYSQVARRCLHDLPSYPWNHSRTYWHESHLATAFRFRKFGRQDLIGAPTADSIKLEPRWRGFLRLSESPWIRDHQVQKTIIYPAAGMMCMVIEAASQITHKCQDVSAFELLDVSILKAMTIPPNEHGLEYALNMKRHSSNADLYEFSIYAKDLNKDWQTRATGKLLITWDNENDSKAVARAKAQRILLEKSCDTVVVPRQLYELLDTMGMNYGHLFRNVTKLRKGVGSCIGKVRMADTKSIMPVQYEFPHVLHPATLDSMFHLLFAIEPKPMVPASIGRLVVSNKLVGGDGSTFVGHATARRVGLHDAEASISMFQEEAPYPLVTIEGLRLTGGSAVSGNEAGFLPNYHNLCTHTVWAEDAAFAQSTQLAEQVAVFAHKHPNLSILQVGGGMPLVATTLSTLSSRQQNGSLPLARYTIASLEGDETWREVENRYKGTSFERYLEQRVVDGSQSLPDYHLIILFDAAFAVDDIAKHLMPEGLILQKIDRARSEVRRLKSSLEVSRDVQQNDSSMTAYRPSLPSIAMKTQRMVVILPRNCEDAVINLAMGIQNLIATEPWGMLVSFISNDHTQSAISLSQGTLVVSLWDIATEMSQATSLCTWDESDFDMFRSLYEAAGGILWISRGSHMNPHNPIGSPIVGLARTLMSENPQTIISTLDLAHDTSLAAPSVPKLILAVFRAVFTNNSTSGPTDVEFAEQEGRLYIPRLTTINPLNKIIEQDGKHHQIVERQFAYDASPNAEQEGLELHISATSYTKGQFSFRHFDLVASLDPCEIEITFESASLTSLDLDTSLGQTLSQHVGLDFNGRILRIGSQVRGFEPGDHVTALTIGGSLRNIVTVDETLVRHDTLSMVPSFLISAYYALRGVHRVHKGSRVLVHAGASAHGLVAVELALLLGAEVFATVSAQLSAAQQSTLLALGLSSRYVIEVDQENVVAAILARTSDKGVDLVYDPLQIGGLFNHRLVRKCKFCLLEDLRIQLTISSGNDCPILRLIIDERHDEQHVYFCNSCQL